MVDRPAGHERNPPPGRGLGGDPAAGGRVGSGQTGKLVFGLDGSGGEFYTAGSYDFGPAALVIPLTDRRLRLDEATELIERAFHRDEHASRDGAY